MTELISNGCNSHSDAKCVGIIVLAMLLLARGKILMAFFSPSMAKAMEDSRPRLSFEAAIGEAFMGQARAPVLHSSYAEVPSGSELHPLEINSVIGQ